MTMIRRMTFAVFGLLTLGVVVALPHVSVAEHVQACTMEYAPVCGERDVVCVRAPCPPVQETFGNTCALNAEHARFLYNGECQGGGVVGSPPSYPTPDPIPVPNPDGPVSDYPTYEPPKRCTSWFDGCNTCARGENGAIGCTVKFCAEKEVGYCTEYDRVTTSPVKESVGTIPNVFKETGKSFVEFVHMLLIRLFGRVIL